MATDSRASGSGERPQTLAVFAEWAAERYGGLPALRLPHGGGDVSYEELRDTVHTVARGLIGLGVAAGDRVAVLCETRAEWTYAHLGVLATGAALVPVYPSAGDEEVAWVLGDSGAGVVLCEDAEKAARVAALVPGVRPVVMTGEAAPMTHPAELAPLAAVLARGAAVTRDDLAMIVYTSGTTGLPKGCRLSHGNSGAISDATASFEKMEPGDVTYIYLPLAHLLAQLTELSTLLDGATLAFWGGRIEGIVPELGQVRPTHLPSVPRLFERVHAQVGALAAADGPEGTARFEAAVALGAHIDDLRRSGAEPTAAQTRAYEEADGKLYALVRSVFGGRLRHANVGGAPIAPQTLDFMRACGIPLYEGYGMTESAGIIALNHPGAHRYGTVGQPLPGCEVRIAADGEILARGPMIFAGYHAAAEATGEALDAEGWLHTGDLGELDADGYLSVTGRKKDIIITSSGKNITPSLLEFAIQQSRWVSRAVMIGDRRPYPVALITLDPDEIAGLGLTGSPAASEQVRGWIQEAVDAANAKAAGPARIRRFTILDEDFSVADETLTPTLKIRRAAVARRYAKEIDGLYES
ncbi:Long-chain-fatty-acid--CoA ligase FadD15 [Streptomyces sp. RB5]|uniref:Acyl-CoA synthetase n=1 Tax=Streptomyces smaragdinus TaxID=2585196 RepID=A0A7K0CJA5_9ACTN|nr:AMP-dependent synthetase/ligase [Streptomyces smaragdinus]MQY13423.1 Long-chain-fatty-acid--CoA ligase FadD15 [Streptomyces smaragdinus]